MKSQRIEAVRSFVERLDTNAEGPHMKTSGAQSVQTQDDVEPTNEIYCVSGFAPKADRGDSTQAAADSSEQRPRAAADGSAGALERSTR